MHGASLSGRGRSRLERFDLEVVEVELELLHGF
jgi:hypothetical protein